MNIKTTFHGAYLLSLLACLPNIDSVDSHQNLGLNVLQLDHYGMPGQLITVRDKIMEMYIHVKELHLNATKYDWRLSCWVLSKLPSADRKKTGHITPEYRQNRTRAINMSAAIPFLSVETLVGRHSKLQALFSDLTRRRRWLGLNY